MSLQQWSHGFFKLALVLVDIALVWLRKLCNLLATKPQEDRLMDDLISATTYAEWYDAAHAIDDLPPKYDWRINPISAHYDYKTLEARRPQLNLKKRKESPLVVADYLRHGLQRNFCNITCLPLYNKTYTSTKVNIEAYVEEVVDTVRWLAELETTKHPEPGKLSHQQRREILLNAKSAHGSTALLLQGGSVFGLCHLGVVKALLEHGMLPNVIMGTATGALMAALICIHDMEELPGFLSGASIDLTAFTAASTRAKMASEEPSEYTSLTSPTGRLHDWSQIFTRRILRFLTQGFVLDPEVLAECVKANVGDLTFQEAFEKTGRVLNIIVSSPNEDIPSLMNYLTAPNFLIRTAALASNIANMSHSRTYRIELLRKDRHGNVEVVPQETSRRASSKLDSNPPLARLKQLFDVDHCIVSQARPYLAPVVKPSLQYIRPQESYWRTLLRKPSALVPMPLDIEKHLKHWLSQIDSLGLLPNNLHRVLSDEMMKGDHVTVVPEIQIRDLTLLLKNPGVQEVDFWIQRGERAVWPSLCALKVRCMIEVALDTAIDHIDKQRRFE